LPGNRYPICSLYLDSSDLRLYQQTVAGEKDRFKLRVRSYSDAPDAPVFLEVKRKQNSIVRKRRVALARNVARDWLRGGIALAAPSAARQDADYFRTHQSLIDARPVVRIRYVREAYVSSGGDPVRITVDTELMHVVTLEDDFGMESTRWLRTPVRGPILELKFTNRFPGWVHELVRCLGLKQQAVPKYGWSVDHLLYEERTAALALGGFTLPPRRA
jgi:SPX domain protein involved in polyphosphate accumulation